MTVTVIVIVAVVAMEAPHLTKAVHLRVREVPPLTRAGPRPIEMDPPPPLTRAAVAGATRTRRGLVSPQGTLQSPPRDLESKKLHLRCSCIVTV